MADASGGDERALASPLSAPAAAVTALGGSSRPEQRGGGASVDGVPSSSSSRGAAVARVERDVPTSIASIDAVGMHESSRSSSPLSRSTVPPPVVVQEPIATQDDHDERRLAVTKAVDHDHDEQRPRRSASNLVHDQRQPPTSRQSTAALAQAGLGLLDSSPPRHRSSSTGHLHSTLNASATRGASFDESLVYDRRPRPSTSSSTTQLDPVNVTSSRPRKISFGNLLESRASESADADNEGRRAGASASTSVTPNQVPPNSTSRKSSGPRALLRKARSFTTSPILGSSATFGQAVPATAPVPMLDPSHPTSISTSAAMATSGSATLTISRKGKDKAVEGSTNSSSNTTTTHWLLAPLVGAANAAPLSAAGTSRGPSPSSSPNPNKSVSLPPPPDLPEHQTNSKKASTKSRRSTFSIFKRHTSSTNTNASDSGTATPTGHLEGPTYDSPLQSPTVSTAPSNYFLPSLPALQLSNSPYRMSWGFGPDSPQSATTKRFSGSAPSPVAHPAFSGSSSSSSMKPPLMASSVPSVSIDSIPTSVGLRRNGSWGGSPRAPSLTTSSYLTGSDAFASEDATATNSWMLRSGINTPPPSVGSGMGEAKRRILTRASRSYSDGSQRPVSIIVQPETNSVMSVDAQAKPLASSSPVTIQQRRPKTSSSIQSSERERSSVFGVVSNFFSSAASSSSSTNLLPASASMSRASSHNSITNGGAGLMSNSNNGETSEFGALFGASPSKNRKRGLSVGNGIFGGSSSGRKRAGSASSLSTSWVPPTTSGGLLAPSDGTDSSSLATPTGRMRASTDPKRLSSTGPVTKSYFPSGALSTTMSSSPSVGGVTFTPPASPTMTRRPSFAFSKNSTSASGTSPPVSRKGSFSIGLPGSNGATLMSRGRSSSAALVPASAPTPVHKIEPEEGETPEAYVDRLVTSLTRSEISRALAQSSGTFSASALNAYLCRFDFSSDALDIALRKFLMDASLPVETQQIDRVMEAFAKRYTQCNDGLFESSDTPYVLAFSLVMLSTDQFNPSNKSKMTKADYVRNTKIEGVGVEVLEYFFDQIALAPFVFVEEDSELGGLTTRPELNPSTSSSFFSSSSTKNRLDPYHLIATGMTRDLRIDVESTIPARSPFSFTGTTSFFNATTLHRFFAHAPVLQIQSNPAVITRTRAKSVDVLTQGAPLEPTTSNMTYVAPPPTPKAREASSLSNVVSSIKVTKVGTLSRKEDLAEGGKKSASRKWKAWSVVLTGSQLLFFKDASFASSLETTLRSAAATTVPPSTDDNQVLVCSISSAFKPDAVLSLAHSAAIYDTSYHKYSNVFRLVAPAGRQYLFQASSPEDLNAWMHCINYAAAFKSAGVRMRGLTSAIPTSKMRPSTAMIDEENRPLSSSGGQEPDGTPRFSASVNERTPVSGTAGHGAVEESLVRRSSMASRAEMLRTKIADIETEIRVAKAKLQGDLRLVRNLSVLTPFKSSTRERIYLALPAIDKRIRHARMNLAKLICHREVLSRDLLVEDRTHSRRPSHRRRVSDQHGAERTPRGSQQPFQPFSTSPLQPPRPSFTISADGLGAGGTTTSRSSFDSAPEDFTRVQYSWTDDELDRLRSPTIDSGISGLGPRPARMQRSTTEEPYSSRLKSDGGASQNGGANRADGEEAPDDELVEKTAPLLVAPKDSPPSKRSNGASLRPNSGEHPEVRSSLSSLEISSSRGSVMAPVVGLSAIAAGEPFGQGVWTSSPASSRNRSSEDVMATSADYANDKRVSVIDYTPLVKVGEERRVGTTRGDGLGSGSGGAGL